MFKHRCGSPYWRQFLWYRPASVWRPLYFDQAKTAGAHVADSIQVAHREYLDALFAADLKNGLPGSVSIACPLINTGILLYDRLALVVLNNPVLILTPEMAERAQQRLGAEAPRPQRLVLT